MITAPFALQPEPYPVSTRRPIKAIFSLAPVDFRNSSIAGRGVFARRRFTPGQIIVPYAPKQRRVGVRDPEATAAAETKLTLLSEGRFVIIPDTSVPGGWLCNHSCAPNAAIFSDGEGRIQCTRAIAPGEEVTIFYGWVSHNEPRRDPCRCGSVRCRGFINFDLGDDDAARVRIDDRNQVVVDDVLRLRLAEYTEFLASIGQEQVAETIADTLVRMKLRKSGSVVCAF
ncbi:MAG: SET domain-containing protein-lysine N-methyltransferase [Myxococcota bacterium]|nr:SET domain-containing protein-lysine N-methyltransferase [Myxococcota bacterium]